MPFKDPEKRKAWEREYWRTHSKLPIYKKYRETHRPQILKYKEERRDWAKKTILSYYSNGTLKCARCGFNDIRALSIDHIYAVEISTLKV